VKVKHETSFFLYGQFGELKKDKLTESYSYYNEDGNITLIKMRAGQLMPTIIHITASTKYGETIDKYDGNKHCVESKSYNPNGTASFADFYKYDSKGNQTIDDNYSSNMEFLGRSVFQYNDKGETIEMKEFDDTSSNFSRREVYLYDDKGNETEVDKFDGVGSLTERDISKYDDKGNEIENSSYGSDSTLSKTTTEIYTYDEYGNWIKEMDYEDGKPYRVVERELEYYGDNKNMKNPPLIFSIKADSLIDPETVIRNPEKSKLVENIIQKGSNENYIVKYDKEKSQYVVINEVTYEEYDFNEYGGVGGYIYYTNQSINDVEKYYIAKGFQLFGRELIRNCFSIMVATDSTINKTQVEFGYECD
jgi:hypothetical protein